MGIYFQQQQKCALLLISDIVLYCFSVIMCQNYALVTALKKQHDFGNCLNALDATGHQRDQGMPQNSHSVHVLAEASMHWHDTVHYPLFYTKGKPDQIRTSSITKCIFWQSF